jgi:hypothetical protein
LKGVFLDGGWKMKLISGSDSQWSVFAWKSFDVGSSADELLAGLLQNHED